MGESAFSLASVRNSGSEFISGVFLYLKIIFVRKARVDRNRLQMQQEKTSKAEILYYYNCDAVYKTAFDRSTLTLPHHFCAEKRLTTCTGHSCA